MVLYSHKRWYRSQGKRFKAQGANRIVEGNIIKLTNLYQRRNEMSDGISWNAENKRNTVIVVYETTPKETFSLRTCEGNSTDKRRKIQKQERKNYTYRTSLCSSGKYKAIRWQIKRCTSHSGDPIPKNHYRHIRASRLKGNEWLIRICFSEWMCEGIGARQSAEMRGNQWC